MRWKYVGLPKIAHLGQMRSNDYDLHGLCLSRQTDPWSVRSGLPTYTSGCLPGGGSRMICIHSLADIFPLTLVSWVGSVLYIPGTRYYLEYTDPAEHLITAAMGSIY